MTSGKKTAAVDMPSFNDLFGIETPPPDDPLAALDAQLGFADG